jgi:hypothetical protein
VDFRWSGQLSLSKYGGGFEVKRNKPARQTSSEGEDDSIQFAMHG